jgi:CheY-like chemotaxis protein
MASLHRPSTTNRSLLSGISVLVVDDHAHSREYLDDALSYHGAAVIAVQSAARALEIVARFTPTIVICDIAMPRHDGVWLLRRLRDHQQATGWYVPVVALTAGMSRPFREDFDAILTKPCNLDTLCWRIFQLTRGIEENIQTA